jgi:GR25 family glycosyltransferase involved in LPS biosynthesis
MKNKAILLIIICLSINLYGDFQKYLKKTDEKKGVHFIENIDFIYMINLDERPEKWKKSIDQLNSYGVYPYRFSAINGWNLSTNQINELGVKFNPKKMKRDMMAACYPLEAKGARRDEIIGSSNYCYLSFLSKGAIGILLSHLSILKDAIDSGYETIWVMEDDIEVIRDPNILSKLVFKLDVLLGKDNWDILFTDQDTRDSLRNHIPCYSFARRPNFIPKNPKRFSKRVQVCEDIIQIGARYGAYSMILRRSGIIKLYNFIKEYKFFLSYDMEYTLPNDIKLFSVKKDIVGHLIDGLSDNGLPNYKKNLISN